MTFHALNGDVKVPKDPKRIAVQNYPDEVASLGANVVGTDSWAFPNTFLSKEQKRIWLIWEHQNSIWKN